MKLFLTGATGFVGLNLLLEALRSGNYDEVIVAVRDSAKLKRLLDGEGTSTASLRVIAWEDPPPDDIDHAVHCAGVLFARDREAYFSVNVDQSLRLLEALPASARLLVLSSQSAGGPTPAGREMRMASDLDEPLTWYGESKREMERRLRMSRPDAMVWRPPMILGPRDRATLPLFRMAAAKVRIKPGLAPKFFSWIAVGDLVRAILFAVNSPRDAVPSGPLGVCAPDAITDMDMIRIAAELASREGVTVRLPQPFMRCVAAVVDAVPSLRAAVPSLTRDRAREIAPDRWVIDGREFRERFAQGEFQTLKSALADTRDWYVRAGLLP